VTPRLFPVNGKVPACPSWRDYDGPPPPMDQPAGWAIPEGVLVVDIDGAEGWASVEEAGLPGTVLWWYSLSGEGAHYVYLEDGPAKNRRVLPGVDVKRHGGYVVVPPAGREKLEAGTVMHDDLPAAPAWAYERNVPKPERTLVREVDTPVQVVDTEPGWRELPTRTPLEERCRRVAEAPEGERNATLNREAYLYGLEWGPDGDDLAGGAFALAAGQAGLDAEESVKTTASGLERGYEEHVDPLANATRAEAPLPAQPQPKHEGQISASPPPAWPRPRRTNEDILALKSPSWLLPGLLVGGALNVLTGFSKAGKSYVSLHWAWQVAGAGRKVLYVPAEAENQFKPRLLAHLNRHGDKGRANLEWWYEEQVLSDSGKHAELLASLHDDPVDLVVIDTLSAAAGGFDENDAGAHVDVAANASDFTSTGAAVLLVHHTGHNKGRGAGSAAQFRRPSMTWNLTREDEKYPGWSKLHPPEGGGGQRYSGRKHQWYEFESVRIPADPAPDGFAPIDTAHVVVESDTGPPAYEEEMASKILGALGQDG
jgi:hypothetical protein